MPRLKAGICGSSDRRAATVAELSPDRNGRADRHERPGCSCVPSGGAPPRSTRVLRYPPGLSPGRSADQGFWSYGWWNILDFRVGIIRIPFYFVLIALIATFLHTGSGKISSNLLVSIAILAVGGFTCGEIGRGSPAASPLLRDREAPGRSGHDHRRPHHDAAAGLTRGEGGWSLGFWTADGATGGPAELDRHDRVRGPRPSRQQRPCA